MAGRGGGAAVDWLAAYGPWGLFLVSLAHDVFSPLPPEVLLVPMGLAAPHSALWLGLVTTLGSVAGGLIGYGLGMALGRPALASWLGAARLDRAETLLRRYDVLALFAAPFTPLPFELVTIPAGVLRVGLVRFLAVAFVARGVRFMAEGAVLFWFGPGLVQWVFGHLTALSLALGALLVAAWLLWRGTLGRRRDAT